MVEQTRQPRRVVSLQAGPGEVDTGTVFGVDRRYSRGLSPHRRDRSDTLSVARISDRTARALARQLAAIGDQLDREWTSRQPNRLPTPLHMLRPAQALTRTMYRDIHHQLWAVHALSAALKARVVTTVPGHGFRRAEAWTAWVSSLKPLTGTDWTRGLMPAVLVAAAVTLVTATWMEWRH